MKRNAHRAVAAAAAALAIAATGFVMGYAVAAQPHMARELRKDHLIGSLIGDVMEIGRHCAALPLGPPR